MANITNNNFNDLNLNISKSEYWDLILTRESDDANFLDGSYFYDENLIGWIDFSNNQCVSGSSIYGLSGYTWPDAFNDGLIFNKSGINSIDNGGILFDKENISSDQFLNLISGYTFSINSGDTRLVLSQVSGNTREFIYPIVKKEDNIRFDGGFYQGFFYNCNNYSVLPSSIDNEITFDFILKPDFLAIPKDKTLNKKYPNNKGIFFYIGLRSENKLWYDYIKNQEEVYPISKTEQTSPFTGSTSELLYYLNIEDQNVTNISTDNKFLSYNRTSHGLTATNGSDVEEYSIGLTETNSINYYTLFNRTQTGSTASKISEISYKINPEYSLKPDLSNNALAFRIKDDGSVGYRAILGDCENPFYVKEEYSAAGLLKDSKTTYVSVRVQPFKDDMKLMFYVDGFLVLTSNILPGLLLRGYDDSCDKQEGVSHNMSIGGGTQGLCDMIGLDSNYQTQYLFPLEENFAGSFIGNIYQFRIFDGRMDYSKIKNNYDNESDITFNPYYTEPIIYFDVSGDTYKEVGDLTTLLIGDVRRNYKYSTINGYNLHYLINQESDRTKINGLFPMSVSGGTFSHSHRPNRRGIMTLQYILEVFDTYHPIEGIIKNKTINFDYMIFYGAANAVPVNSIGVRSLPEKVFSNQVTTFSLNTYSTYKTFVIAMPTTKKLYRIEDKDVMYLNITDLFDQTFVNVKNLDNEYVKYRVYALQNAIPYSLNHEFLVTITESGDIDVYRAPYFDYFRNSIPVIVECGVTISGSTNFEFMIDSIDNAKSNSLKIVDVNTGESLIEDQPLLYPVSININTIKNTQSGMQQKWKGVAENSDSEQFESDEYAVTWRNKVFFGEVDVFPLTSQAIRNLQNSVWDNQKTFPIRIENLKYTIAIPDSLSILSVVTENNEDITDNFTQRVDSVPVYIADGQTTELYKLYDFSIVVPIFGGITATVTIS